jgi:hypothetical protein
MFRIVQPKFISRRKMASGGTYCVECFVLFVLLVCHRRMADKVTLLQWIKLFHNCVPYYIGKNIGGFYFMDLIDQACCSV